DCRRISEARRNTPHDRGDRPLLLAFRLRESLPGGALGEVDRSEQGAAPGTEVLRAELVPEIDLHVLVQPLVGEVVRIALPLVLEDAGPLELEQAAHCASEIRVHDLGADADPVLRRKGEADAAAA